VLKSESEIAIMDEANRIVRSILAELADLIRPGTSTIEIDRYAEESIRKAGATPAFKGYPHRNDGRDFPGTVCTSINDEVVHGVPSARVVLKEGDILSVDLGAIFRGYYGDAALTYPVGKVDPLAERLLRVTQESLAAAVDRARPGNRISDIGHAVQSMVESEGFSVVREFAGHGIGSRLHEDPQVPNYGMPGRGARLVPGMVLALEPMVNAGGADVVLSAADGWTARTKDGSLSAHFEVSVAVTDNGPRILGGPLAMPVAR
jgi:methionyl aminopeptidase